MSNTILRVETSNTFDQWRIVTNTLVNAVNDLRNNTFIKDSGGLSLSNGSIILTKGNIQVVNGTLQLDKTTGETLYVAADARVGGNLIVTSGLTVSGANVFESVLRANAAINKANNAANTVRVTANSGSTQSAVSLNFNNTSTVLVSVGAGSAGNANVEFSAVAGSTAAAGILQLTDSVTSTSTTTAATPNSVKNAFDQATLAYNQANVATNSTNTSTSRTQVSANSGSIQSNVAVNFNNTSTVLVSVGPGTTGNANVSFAVIPNFTTQLVAGGGASFTAGQTVSFNNTSTAPFTVASTTKVTNLNADLLDGYNVGTSGDGIPLLSGTNTFGGTQTFSALLTASSGLNVTGNTTITNSTPGDALRITQTGSGNTLVINDASGDTSPIVIDNSGIVVVGAGVAYDAIGGAANPVSVLQLHGSSTLTGKSKIASMHWSSDAGRQPSIELMKSASSTVGNHTLVVNNESLGALRWGGSNGTQFVVSASIEGETDGTPSSTTMPGKIIFNTNGGGTAVTERMSIANTGAVKINNLAGSGSRTVTADATGILSAASDSSLKQEVSNTTIPGLVEVLQIQPKAYKWLSDIGIRGANAAIEIGFFADQVAQIIPSAAPKSNDGLYGFYDRSMIAALVKSVQELKDIVDAQAAEISDLKTRVETLEGG